jgi:hypothetical protein
MKFSDGSTVGDMKMSMARGCGWAILDVNWRTKKGTWRRRITMHRRPEGKLLKITAIATW